MLILEGPFKSLRKAADAMKGTIHVGFDFVELDPGSVRLVLFSNGSLANEAGMICQWVFVIFMADGFGKHNILHYKCSERHWESQPVMVAEVYALIDAVDHG